MTAERRVVTKHGITLTLNKPPTTEVQVAALESRLSQRLPDDYREFLLLYNGGGRPDRAVFNFALRTGPYTDSMVDWFLSLHDGPYSNIEKTVAQLNGRYPPDLLPIANDPGGNYIMLGLTGKERGKVYFWDHEREPERQPCWSNIDLVADSFDDFVNGLRIPDV